MPGAIIFLKDPLNSARLSAIKNQNLLISSNEERRAAAMGDGSADIFVAGAKSPPAASGLDNENTG